MTPFHGAKLALFLGDDLAVYLRDDRPGLPFAGCWDFPGGGREADEDPETCVLRETREEFGLALGRDDLVHRAAYAAESGARVWFFAAHLPASRAADVEFGDEGQFWRLMSPREFIAAPRSVPALRLRLRDYMMVRRDVFPFVP